MSSRVKEEISMSDCKKTQRIKRKIYHITPKSILVKGSKKEAK